MDIGSRLVRNARTLGLAALLGLVPLAIGALGSGASAQVGGISVTPQLVVLEGRSRSESLSVINRGTTTETYRVSFVNYRMLPGGEMELVEQPADGEGFADRLIRYSPRQVTLEPGQPQTVRLLLRAARDLPDGEYRSHLLFQQVPNESPPVAAEESTEASGLTFNIRAIFGVAIPVIVRRGELSAEARLTDFQPVRSSDGVTRLSFSIKRAGTRSLRGHLVARVGDTEVGRISNLAVYLSTDHREIELALDDSAVGTLSGRQVTVEYRERAEDGGKVIASAAVAIP